MTTGRGKSGLYDYQFYINQSAGMLYFGYFVWGRKSEPGDWRRDFSLPFVPTFSRRNVDFVENS